MRFSLLPRFSSPFFPVAPPKLLRLRFNNMTTGKPTEPPPPPVNVTSSSNAKVNKLQQLIHSGPTTGGWDESWKQGLTPWDLGSPTPVLLHLHNTGSLPQGRALIPGCGSGHDVVAIASPQLKVVGLDVSERAIERAAQLSSGSPNAEHFTFLKTDFFNWCPEELFDLIFDYTFFCAIEPNLRLLWAKKIRGLLKPDGELITLMFPIDNHKGGPPYKVSIADYEEVLHPVGFKATYIAENELAVAPRLGKEKLGRWKRSGGPSSL